MTRTHSEPTQQDQVQDPLRIHATADGITVAGELTFATCAQLEARLRELDAAGAADLVLDVADVTFCDSSGLSTMIGAHRRAQRRGGGVTLRGANGPLARLLALTGIGRMLTVEPESRSRSGETA